MELQKAKPTPTPKARGAVVTKAAVRAADHLNLANVELGKILGLSPATVSRMRNGQFVLDADGKAFELAALFVRLYRSLDAVVGGDDLVAATWIRRENLALQKKPIDLIQKVVGITHVLQYLDTRRAII